MSTTLEAIRDKPIALFPLDNESPFVDASGYGRAGTATGATKAISLAAGAQYSTAFNRRALGKFESPVFKQGYEDKPFSLEAWVRPVQRSEGVGYTALVEDVNENRALTDWVANSTGATLELEDVDFFGETVTAMRATSNTSTQFYTPIVNIDPTKGYRIRLWVKDPETAPASYQFYLGIHLFDDSGSSTLDTVSVFRPTGAETGLSNNFYFIYKNGATPDWTYIETYVFPTDATATQMANAGVYPSDFSSQNLAKFIPEATRMRVRYLNWGNEVDRTLWVTGLDVQEVEYAAPGVWEPVSEPSTGPQQILGHHRYDDGLMVDGTKVSFVTKHLTGECRAEYDLQVNRRVHVAGVHTSDKNMLFVDGELVAETEYAENQIDIPFVSTDGFLYSGDSDASSAVEINNLAIYPIALSTEAVARHFSVGNNHLDAEVVAGSYSGIRIPLVQNEADIFLEQSWTTEYDWTSSSFMEGVVSENDSLKPHLVAGVSVPGTWLDVFPLDVSDATSIYGVNMVWDGEGAIVEASLDGLTWETVERGKNLDIIPPGFDPTEKELEIRITFPGGITDDSSFVDNLTVTGFNTGIVPEVGGRPLTYTSPAYVRNDHQPIELSNDWGTEFRGGSAVIGTNDSEDPMNPMTIEVWFKRVDTAGDTYLVDTRVAENTMLPVVVFRDASPGFYHTNAQYVNGELVSAAGYSAPLGEWICLHIVADAPVVNEIKLNRSYSVSGNGSNAQIGQVVLYEDALTAAQVKEIYDSYVGMPVQKATDGATISMSEPTNAAQIYAHDWSISASG